MPNVFIADDSAEVRGVVRTFIEASTPCNVCGEAADGVAAIEKVKQSSCDLIILDLRMPKRDGIETASTLRSILPNLKILGYSMFVRDLENRLLLATGFDMVIAKQDGLPKLGEAIGTLLRTPTGERAAPPLFSISKVAADGDPIWVQSSPTLDDANARVQKLGQAFPGTYIIHSHKTGHQTVVKVTRENC